MQHDQHSLVHGQKTFMNHIFFSESDICSPTRVVRFTNASYETVLFSEAEEYSEISIVRFSIN